MRTERSVQTALLVAVFSLCLQAPATTSWSNFTTAGTSYWNVNSNWDASFPNAAGTEAVIHGNFTAGDVSIRLGQNIMIGALTMGDTNPDPTSGFTVEIADYSSTTLTLESNVAGGTTFLKVPVDIVQDPAYAPDAYIRAPLYLGGTSPLVIQPEGQLTLEKVYFQGNALVVTNSGALQNITLNNLLYGNDSSWVVGNAGAQATKINSAYEGSIEWNAGTLSLASGGFPAAKLMRIHSGGLVVVGSNSAFDPNPGQRLPTQRIELAGGQLNANGQALKGSALNGLVGDTVDEILLSKGQNRVELQTSATSSGTYLRAKVLSRSPGTLLNIAASKLGTALDATNRGQQFQVEGALPSVGAGGAEGTKTMSIVPWIFCKNTYYGHVPDYIGTPTANGLRGLYDAEMDTTLAGTDNRNVNPSSIALAADQTVNSLRCNFYNASNMGANRTLHVTSGAVLLLRDNTRLGEIASAAAGTLDFGTAEGCVHAVSIAEGNAAIGAVITGSGGLTVGGPGRMRITGANTYSGTTTVASGLVQVGDGTANTATACLGNGTVQVCANATLRIASNVANAVPNSASLILQKAGLKNGKLELQTGINEVVQYLYLGETGMPSGTYGGTGSGAANILPAYFGGTGVLTVTHSAFASDPTTLILLR